MPTKLKMIESIWKDAIMKILSASYPKAVHLTEIYREIENFIALDDHMREPWKDNLQPRYQCWIREYLSLLKKDGLVENVKRGFWRATSLTTALT